MSLKNTPIFNTIRDWKAKLIFRRLFCRSYSRLYNYSVMDITTYRPIINNIDILHFRKEWTLMRLMVRVTQLWWRHVVYTSTGTMCSSAILRWLLRKGQTSVSQYDLSRTLKRYFCVGMFEYTQVNQMFFAFYNGMIKHAKFANVFHVFTCQGWMRKLSGLD